MKRQLLFVILALTNAACWRREEPVAAAAGKQPPASEQVEVVATSPVVETYRSSGAVRAHHSAAIAAKIAASISDFRVKAGDRVKAGAILILLDSRDLQTNLHRWEAARAEAESAISETEHNVAAASANVELARVTHKRFETLLAQSSVSRQEFDESQARLKSAAAALDMAVARRRQAEARRSQADAEVATARVALGHATLLAPFAGLVTERKGDPGSLATPGTPLLTLEREGNLRLETSIDESRLGLVRIGEQVAVEIDSLDRRLNGRVAEIVPVIDTVSRTFIAKIDLPSVPGLRAGMFGRAAFPEGKREALLIPQSAVLERGQIRSVYVLEGDAARLRLVSLGESRDNRREVLSGLTPGERIVVAPSPLLSDGRRVATQEASR